DLLGRGGAHLQATHRAVLDAGAGEQQAQVVVDLGDRADGRARVAVGGLLVDRDRGREPLDQIDRGRVHLPQELPGVGRQRLDVASLPSAKLASQASELLPDPDRPENTTSRLRGMSMSMLLRLCSRAPRTTRESVTRPSYERGPTFEQLFAGDPRDTAPYWEHGSSRIHRTCRSRRPQRATGAAVAG